MQQSGKKVLHRMSAPFMEMFGLSRAVAITTVLFLGAVVLLAVFWFFYSAPPHQLIITSGAPGSSYETNAMKYRRILARSGVTLKVLPSAGSSENLERLQDPSFKVDIGFVQGGVTNSGPAQIKLVSLGSISYQLLLVFYRGSNVTLLSDLKGKRLAVGPEGSGTRALALSLLRLNDVKDGDGTVFEKIEVSQAAKALLNGSMDAVFVMGDSASPQLIRQLLLNPEIRLLNFPQAEAYARRISYLNRLELPQGGIDFGKNIPAQNISLIAPTVELLARPGLHPALCDLLIEAAQEVHGTSSLLRKKGEFPSPIEQDYPISSEAAGYYKSGKGFLYRSLPFWLASLLNRILVAFVPMVVLLVPTVRLIPTLLRLRVRLRLYRWYRALLALERDARTWPAEEHPQLFARLDQIEHEVNKMKVPASFADQYYTLRGSIGFVRQRVAAEGPQRAKVP